MWLEPQYFLHSLYIMIHKKFTIDSGATRSCRRREDKISNKSDTPNQDTPRVVSLKHSGYSCHNNPSETVYEQQFALKPNNNLREDSSSRISERQLIHQTSHNPYCTGSSYINDLVTQEKFLRPANSSYE